MNATTAEIPPYTELLWPALCAVRELGHSAAIVEIDEQVIQAQAFSSEQLALLHKNGPRTEIEYRLAWARTYLKGMGALDNPTRGTWITTGTGKTLEQSEIEPLRKAYLAKRAEQRKKKRQAAKDAGADIEFNEEPADDDEYDWREDLLAHLLSMNPTSFEHLAKRLLRAAGFVNTSVTGGQWLLTYDADARVTDELYQGYRCAEFSMAHSAAVHHTGKEYAVFAPSLNVESIDKLGTGRARFLASA